jgi:hypothetical protein
MAAHHRMRPCLHQASLNPVEMELGQRYSLKIDRLLPQIDSCCGVENGRRSCLYEVPSTSIEVCRHAMKYCGDLKSGMANRTDEGLQTVVV